MSKIIKIVIGLGVVGLILYFGSGYLGRGATPTGPVAVTAGAENGAGSDVLSVLNALNSVSFDVGFFGNKVFQSLADFSVVLSPREAGRDNPFAPVRAGSSAPNPPSAPLAPAGSPR